MIRESTKREIHSGSIDIISYVLSAVSRRENKEQKPQL